MHATAPGEEEAAENKVEVRFHRFTPSFLFWIQFNEDFLSFFYRYFRFFIIEQAILSNQS